jgi:hypothetical protein
MVDSASDDNDEAATDTEDATPQPSAASGAAPAAAAPAPAPAPPSLSNGGLSDYQRSLLPKWLIDSNTALEKSRKDSAAFSEQLDTMRSSLVKFDGVIEAANAK